VGNWYDDAPSSSWQKFSHALIILTALWIWLIKLQTANFDWIAKVVQSLQPYQMKMQMARLPSAFFVWLCG